MGRGCCVGVGAPDVAIGLCVGGCRVPGFETMRFCSFLTSKLLKAPRHLAREFSSGAHSLMFFSSHMTCIQWCLLLDTESMSTASMMLEKGMMRLAEYS